MFSGLVIFTFVLTNICGQVLVPPYTNLALGKRITATATCGEINGKPIKEMFCQIAGSNQYSPHNQYSYTTVNDRLSVFQEFKAEKQSFVQGGQICDFCQANTSFAHPAENMVDGMATWWQSPPLSRGMRYNKINITIDLEQEFHVAYVWIQMASSPRPASWILERSVDYGKTFMPWQYFAETPAECARLFGRNSLQPIIEDDSVICTHEYSGIHPIENAEIMINLMEDRPGRHNFSHSLTLQSFSRATNVRLQLLRTKTLHGHLMDVNRRNDPTVTRRYYYAIKEIFMGGRCVCNGHAGTCDILDARRPRLLVCRCEHNTCGDQCERCCPGYEQKQWRRTKEGEHFVCEPCNCHGHSEECEYDAELDAKNLSLDIHGNYNGGGRCLNCRDNTEGVNCNKCSFGYYRPKDKLWNETDVCHRCVCDPLKHTGACQEETGHCECKPQFTGENCDKCALGYYGPPECKPCECSLNGTIDEICLPEDGQCPCKSNYGGLFCSKCALGYTNFSAGCIECKCETIGSVHSHCNENSSQCSCKSGFAGLSCDKCASGYFNYPKCEYCDCDPSGTEAEICDKASGKCICKGGFFGEKCDQCQKEFYGYPHCKECNCSKIGSQSLICDTKTGDCQCYANFTSRICDRCAPGFYEYPKCMPCSCLASGSKGLTCDSQGHCYCKDNFQGEKCDKCKENFYNFPICEECNCNPNGVVTSFAGCDKVAPGELCTCKRNVAGRTCDQCQPTYWDLQYHHEDGCVECDCDIAGSLSMLNTCDLVDGQCFCKRYASGRKCNKCAYGFYDLQLHNQLACRKCKCDVGGALGIGCDIKTGQCKCRPRITGKRCNEPIENHYFPTLWHNKYEAEDGLSPENRAVRFTTDQSLFPNSSMRGYAVFSPIQDEVILEITISKASIYRLLLHLMNPTTVDIGAEIIITPTYTHTQDVEQSVKATFSPMDMPSTICVNKNQPFVLNPGRWRIHIRTKQRLFLDYIVLLPSEYYEGTLLKESPNEPCEGLSKEKNNCVDFLYPPLKTAARTSVEDGLMTETIEDETVRKPLEKMPIEILPAIIGNAAYIRADNRSRQIHMEIEAPETSDYVLLVEYYNLEKERLPVIVNASLDSGESLLKGIIAIHHCPYTFFCREIVTNSGNLSVIHLKENDKVHIIFDILPLHQFGLAAINLIKLNDWSTDYLKMIPICVRKNDKCVDQWYPPAANAIVTEAEADDNLNISISAENLPFNVANSKHVFVIPLDKNQKKIDISGVVPINNYYVLIVQYYNPDNAPFISNVLLETDRSYKTYVPFAYCPSIFGCRALIHHKELPELTRFWIDNNYNASFHYNASQNGPLYIDSITSVPYQSYSDALMEPQPIDLSTDFVKNCDYDNFRNE